MSMDLTKKHCKPCEGGTKPFTKEVAEKYLSDLDGWELIEDDEFKIRKHYKFETFRDAIKFINKVADLAETEDHHPNIFNSYTKATLTFFTHSIGGLSINDFIMASKIESIG